jgi:peptidoglycan-associated lipoprotein
MYNRVTRCFILNQAKGVFMRNAFFKGIVVLSLPIMLISGCGKDQVKPDAGIAPDTAVSASSAKQSSAAADLAAAERAALDKAAAEKAAAERAAAERAAAEKATAERAAAEKAMAEKAAAERAAADKAAADKAAAAEQAATESAKTALQTVHFDFDSYVLRQADRDILYSNAEYLLKKYKGKVKLEGHCDERGSDEYNLALGENRAKAALNYLLTLGVPAEQLSIVSYGKEKPLDNGHTEEAWAKNRRVEFSIVK